MKRDLYRHMLKSELERRCSQNANYSLRSFARSLSVDPASLSRVLNGKKQLTIKGAQKILTRINYDPVEREQFLKSVTFEKAGHTNPAFISNEFSWQPADLDVEVFKVIGDWYHYAILELTCCQNFVPEMRWIARQIGLSLVETKLAVERLLTLGLLEQVDNTYKKTNKHVSTSQKNLTTSAHRQHQKQMLEKSITSLEEDSIEKRDHRGMTMAIDPDKIFIAKKMIDEFINTLCLQLESGRQKQVYQLAVNLFPLQKGESE